MAARVDATSDSPEPTGRWNRWTAAYRKNPGGVGIDLLRIGMGLVWALDMVFILDPANQYFSTFQSVAQGYGTQSLGGPAIPDFVAAHSVVFAWLVAVATGYLAVAFLFGVTTRLACYVGMVASVFFLWTQFNMTFMIPGGTDVGAHPLYLLTYVVLLTGGAGRYFAGDAVLWTDGGGVRSSLGFLVGPRPPMADHPVTSGPAPRDRRRATAWAAGAVAAFTALMLASTAVAVLPAPGATDGPGATSIVAIQYTILYPGNVSSGGFGPANQSGCFACSISVAPGAIATEEVMLTNNGSGVGTVRGLTVGLPFHEVGGPTLPATLKSHQMWMFGIELQTPPEQGAFTVQITFSVD